MSPAVVACQIGHLLTDSTSLSCVATLETTTALDLQHWYASVTNATSVLMEVDAVCVVVQVSNDPFYVRALRS